MIEVQNISKSFSGQKVLNDITANFEKGKTNLIIGQSGSGKTVLMKCCIGLIDIDEGDIYFDSTHFSHLTEKKKRETRKEMGMLFQGSALFNYLNIFENIAFPLREHTKIAESVIKTIVTMKLEMVGLRGTEHLMP